MNDKLKFSYALSETVERFSTYDVMMASEGHPLTPSPDGGFVRFTDYANMEAHYLALLNAKEKDNEND